MLQITVLALRILVASTFLLYGLEKALYPSIARGILSRYLPAGAPPATNARE